LPDYLKKKVGTFRDRARDVDSFDAIFGFFEDNSDDPEGPETYTFYAGIRGVSKVPMCEYYHFEGYIRGNFEDWGYLAHKVEGCRIETVTAGSMDLTPFVTTKLCTEMNTEESLPR